MIHDTIILKMKVELENGKKAHDIEIILTNRDK